MTQHDPGAPRNRLAAETSPYLLQHAANPVDWHPWGPAALELARRTDKPILLSIGYSACHWCHVMAHESFEDEATAALMNELFVCVKVDREERPDLDKVYQLSHQLLTQRGGGWPLTMFLSPADLTPFFGGTYFPPEARWGMPSFRDLLQRAAGYYRERRDEIGRQNAALREVFDDLVPPPATAGIALTRAPIDAARQDLEASFDAQFGGFGGAPKFPHAGSIDRLLRDWHATATASEPDLQALYMATLTLKRMTEGGLYDQLGGGFCRYSVDAYWMIPHFEKMLYDNGPLLALAAQAAIATGEGLFRRAAIETGEWALREMQSPEGGFYSALDADSDGHEGKFYAWDRAEVEALLTPGEYRAFARRYGLDREANFEGKWHLHCFVAIDEIAAELGLEADAVAEIVDAARAKLLSVRNRRVWPGRDDKVLTAWNGLMIRGLAVAGRALERADFVTAAARAADFIRTQCWRDGQLLAAYKDGQARFPAYLDDYAFLLEGLLELLQARWRSEDLAFAQALADALLQRFEDRDRGGFWFTAEGAETPLYRPKGFADEAMPAGNGVAAAALARLGWLVGETRYLDAAERTLRGGWESILRAPQAHTTMLAALEEFLQPGDVIILRGEDSTVGQWQAALAPLYAPRRSVYAIPASAADLPPALAAKLPRGPAVAYVCSGPQCSPPIEELTRLTRWLRDGVLTDTQR